MIEYIWFKELETTRLHLRKQKAEDVPAFHKEIASSRKVSAYMLWDATDDIAVTADKLSNYLEGYQEKGYYRWMIEKKEDRQLIGVIQLVRFDEEQESCEFAYMLGEAHWNQGFMTEALKRVFQFVFEELELLEIHADHFCENPASGKVMQKAGMKLMGYAENVHQNEKGLNEVALYQINKADFYMDHLNQDK